MKDYKIIENDVIYNLGENSYEKLIYINCKGIDFTLKENININVNECILVNCKIKKFTISKIKSSQKIIFINCKIREFHIKKSYLPNLQFIGCDIFNSYFEDSILPGLIFSQDTGEIPDNALKKIKKYVKSDNSKFSRKSSINESIINNSRFIFCELNDMRIDKTMLKDSKFKHCNVKRLEIEEDVIFKNIDIRGSKFFESDFGVCDFSNIKFRKGFFWVEWIVSILRILFTIFYLISSIIPIKKWPMRKRNIKGRIGQLRHFIKKNLYKIKLEFFIDYFSTTDCQKVQYKDADFSEDYHFLWHIQDIDYIYEFKKKHPIFALITYWSSNYMRSFVALLFSSSLVVWLFSLAFKSNWVNFGTPISPSYHLYLSFKIFTNFGIDPLDAGNLLTQSLVVFEIIIGYLALGILLSIIIFPFSRRTSLPGGNKRRDNSK